MSVFEYTTVSYMVKRDHAFYENRVFIILLTRARHCDSLSSARWRLPTPSQATLLLSVLIQSPRLVPVFQMALSLQKFSIYFSPHTSVLQVSPISQSFISWT